MEALKVGVHEEVPYVEKCVLGLSTLATTQECTYLGIGAEILRNALEIVRVPHSLVPLRNYSRDDVGVYNDTTGTWTGS